MFFGTDSKNILDKKDRIKTTKNKNEVNFIIKQQSLIIAKLTSFSSIPCASRGGSYSVIVILALTFQHLTEAMLVQQATLMTLDLDLHFMVIREYKLKY